jgi:PhnB protein
MERLHPYLEFGGGCRDAMTSYKEWFGGELSLIPVGESPSGGESPEVRNAIYHSELKAPHFTLMGSDVLQGAPLTGAVVAVCENADEIGRIFDMASDGGNVLCGLGPAPWGGLYAHLTDRFGVTWHLTCETSAVDRPTS